MTTDSPTYTYVTLAQAKAQLRIDPSVTIDDDLIEGYIGAAIDWAENYTNRSLGELLELNSPADSAAVPVPDPSWPEGCPSSAHVWDRDYGLWVDTTEWGASDYRGWWARYPASLPKDTAAPLRRDVKAALLLYVETLYDKNPDNFVLLEARALNMLNPYRLMMGV